MRPSNSGWYRQNWIKSVGLLLVILIAFSILESLLPLATAVKIGADEDFELSKVTLCSKGFKLYTEIWNDQPPLNTAILTLLTRNVSPRILGPRLFSVCSALILISAIFFFILRINGATVAFIAAALLCASPGFIELSSSSMQEVPALAPTATALCVLLMGPLKKAHSDQIFAGFLFGFALQLKLIGLVYVPLAVFIILQHVVSNSSKFMQARSYIISLVIFLGTIILTFAFLNWITGSPLLLQLEHAWGAHFSAAKSFEFGSPNDHPFDWTLLLKNWDACLPALCGVFLVFRRWILRETVASNMFCPLNAESPSIHKTASLNQLFPKQSSKAIPPRMIFLPVVWLALTLLVFSIHKPWWAYYYVHNSVPICWCAAIGVVGSLELIGLKRMAVPTQSKRGPTLPTPDGGLRRSILSRFFNKIVLARALILVVLGLAGSWMVARVFLEEETIRSSPQLESCLVLKEIERFKPFTKFLFAYEAIYSFHSDIPMPPRLAMSSLKRFWSGEMNINRMITEIETLKP